MIVVTKFKCKTCKKRFTHVNKGRRPIYCSPACRQKSYRKRIPKVDPVQLTVCRELEKLKGGRRAVVREAVKVLKSAGYTVHLEAKDPDAAAMMKLLIKSGLIPDKKPPNLRVVQDAKDHE